MNENIYKNLSITDSSLSVHNAAHVKCSEGDGWGSGIKDYYVLFHIVSGKGIFISGGKKYLLEKGDSFLIYPFTETEYHADEKEPWEYYKIGFSGTCSKELLEFTDFSEDSPVLTFNFDSKLETVMKKMCAVDTHKLFHNVDSAGLMFSVFSVLMDFSVYAKRTDADMDFRISKAIEYVKYNYQEQITADKAAKYAGIDTEEFGDLFEKSNRMSFEDYLDKYRIERSCEFIEKYGLSVASAANSVGYSDSLYFTKLFRKLKGISPSQYQKKKSFFSALVK